MTRTILKTFIGVILIVVAWLYLVPYVMFVSSPFAWREADIDNSRFVSPTEADYYASYGERQYVENGKNCTEYFALKDGLPLKKKCK